LTPPLRVALFTDSFVEANGVATLSREFAAFAERRQLPFFCVHSGPQTRVICHHPLTTLELRRSVVSLPLDHELRCDLLLSRYKNWVTAQLRSFKADLVHITGPGDFGVLGFWVAHSLGIPLVASWHTNLHEYAGRRLDKLFSFLPGTLPERLSSMAEQQSLRALVRFYRLARFVMAPNEAMIQLLREQTRRPTFCMPHGVDVEVFSPARRKRLNGSFCIGYVGRLTPEKNVRFFVELEQSLLAAGQRNFRLVLVGDGSEKQWLRKNLQSAELPGVLRGDALAAAFADMDVFVFPSQTDTFGLVLLEAMASGVPVVVSPETGVRAGVQHAVTGFFAPDLSLFTKSVLGLMVSETLRQEMSRAAVRFACSCGWSAAFEQVYRAYEVGLAECGLMAPCIKLELP
jgi:phosphatidylinositol alpha 1,6-mannosyltransferase